MKVIAFLILALQTFACLHAIEPLKDYGHIQGVCHALRKDTTILRRDLNYAKRLNINSTRVWLSYQDYERNPESYINALITYVRTAHEMGISVMPIILNTDLFDMETLDDKFHARMETFVKAVVKALKDEPGLLMWDVLNEPLSCRFFWKAPETEQKAHAAVIWDFVRRYTKYVKKLDKKNAVTVGTNIPYELEHVGDLVDVLSFHDYSTTEVEIKKAFEKAMEYSQKYNKPLINTEMSCICRANPYDLTLEIARDYKIGFYVFDLICEGYWGDVHGIVYPDGTVRDPSIVASLLGFYRNRDLKTTIRPNPDKEGYAVKALKQIEKALSQETESLRNRKSSTDELLEAAEFCANLLEASEMVPMYELPTAKIRAWRAMSEKERDVETIRRFTYELGLTLKKYCQFY